MSDEGRDQVSCGCATPSRRRGEEWACPCGIRWLRIDDGWLDLGYVQPPIADETRNRVREGLAQALNARIGDVVVDTVAPDAVPAEPVWSNAWPISVPTQPGALVVSLAEADTSTEDIERLRSVLGERLGMEIIVIAGATGVTFVPELVDPDAQGPLAQDADLR